MRGDLGRIKPFCDAFIRFFRNFELRHFATFQGRCLPARDRRITFRARNVTPTTEFRVLRGDDEVQRLLGWIVQLFVSGDAVGFAQRNRRNSMAVEPSAFVGDFIGGNIQIAVGLLMLEQIFQSAAHHILIFAVVVVIVGAEVCQQRQARGRAIGVDDADVGFRGSWELMQAPVPIGGLHPRQKFQALFYARFGAAIRIVAAGAVAGTTARTIAAAAKGGARRADRDFGQCRATAACAAVQEPARQHCHLIPLGQSPPIGQTELCAGHRRTCGRAIANRTTSTSAVAAGATAVQSKAGQAGRAIAMSAAIAARTGRVGTTWAAGSNSAGTPRRAVRAIAGSRACQRAGELRHRARTSALTKWQPHSRTLWQQRTQTGAGRRRTASPIARNATRRCASSGQQNSGRSGHIPFAAAAGLTAIARAGSWNSRSAGSTRLTADARHAAIQRAGAVAAAGPCAIAQPIAARTIATGAVAADSAGGSARDLWQIGFHLGRQSAWCWAARQADSSANAAGCSADHAAWAFRGRAIARAGPADLDSRELDRSPATAVAAGPVAGRCAAGHRSAAGNASAGHRASSAGRAAIGCWTAWAKVVAARAARSACRSRAGG